MPATHRVCQRNPDNIRLHTSRCLFTFADNACCLCLPTIAGKCSPVTSGDVYVTTASDEALRASPRNFYWGGGRIHRHPNPPTPQHFVFPRISTTLLWKCWKIQNCIRFKKKETEIGIHISGGTFPQFSNVQESWPPPPVSDAPMRPHIWLTCQSPYPRLLSATSQRCRLLHTASSSRNLCAVHLSFVFS